MVTIKSIVEKNLTFYLKMKIFYVLLFSYIMNQILGDYCIPKIFNSEQLSSINYCIHIYYMNIYYNENLQNTNVTTLGNFNTSSSWSERHSIFRVSCKVDRILLQSQKLRHLIRRSGTDVEYSILEVNSLFMFKSITTEGDWCKWRVAVITWVH